MTIFAVMTALLFPVIHTGRPWYAAIWLLPYPNQRQLLGELPFSTSYGTCSQWELTSPSRSYFGLSDLIPDLAAVRDQSGSSDSPEDSYIRSSQLGWRGSNKAWSHYEIALS